MTVHAVPSLKNITGNLTSISAADITLIVCSNYDKLKIKMFCSIHFQKCNNYVTAVVKQKLINNTEKLKAPIISEKINGFSSKINAHSSP